MAACGVKDVEEKDKCDNCDQCLKVERSTKVVRVPVLYNTYQEYNVKVPRQVNETRPRTEYYTDYETRHRQVPYTVNRRERRTRTETRKYQVPIRRCYTEMQTKEKQVAVPYYVNVPETKMQTVTYQAPVRKSKIWMDTVINTVYDTQVRRRCVPHQVICSKEIPVYSVISKPQMACLPGINDDGLLYPAEHQTVRASSNQSNSSARVSVVIGAGNGSRSHISGNGKSIPTTISKSVSGNGKSMATALSDSISSRHKALTGGYIGDTTPKVVW